MLRRWRPGAVLSCLLACGTLHPGPLRAAPPRPRDHGEMPPPRVIPGEKVTVAHLDLGQRMMEKGDLAGALTEFNKAQALSPKDPAPLYLRGVVYQKMKRIAEAEADFRKALALDPRLTEVRTELAALLSDSGRSAEALPLLETAAAERPDYFEAHFNLGIACETLGRWPEAARAYEQAARLRPKESDVRINLAAAYRKLGRLEDAVRTARESVRLAPDDALAHLNLGIMLGEAGRTDEAIAEMSAAVRLKPDFHKAWWRLGVARLKAGQAKEAVDALARARGIKATPEVLTDLGRAQRRQGDVQAAEASLRQALAADAKFHPARVHLAHVLATSKRCKDALRELALLPDQPEYKESANRVRAECQHKR